MTFEVRNGCFGYGRTQILSDINFSVDGGEILAVLGANGAGKTTLLKCLLGLLKWRSGNTFVDGRNIGALKAAELWRYVAYVPQAKQSVFGYSALDMVLLGRSSRVGTFSQPKSSDLAAAEQALNDTGITHLKDRQCSRMSGGELQMVLIARALCAEPRLLVLDEPESNLDFKNQLVILETVKKLSRERHISAIINTHYPNHALQLADKALLLDKAGSACFGRAAEIISESNMKNVFGVRVHISEFAYQGTDFKTVTPLCIA
ncbi:ABC transporter ATP-binding protein [Treponema brennaborense]|uniref:Phosphonate-transporting ATPase n=1 Tax=Treponema brennaborense (strain DSM 12168 / CIP 105900 / DD5/3) TaxID=906968 RepID=F4LLJ1_TREBD|nr:ABC transporter ATP-binding protein [Treponema brennaborense]AEE16655.1 Phosphonate-transporting ATPase [Treponema brennaborense DSM 12168]